MLTSVRLAQGTPDPTDGATLGALESAIAEHYDGIVWSQPDRDYPERWCVLLQRPPKTATGRTSLEAIGQGTTRFEALIAAWKGRPR